MSATTAGAFKAYIEQLGLGLAAYRDEAPQGVVPPYISITESISSIPDAYAGVDVGTTRETVQVDLWQTYRKAADNAGGENLTWAPALVRALHGARINFAPDAVYGVLVRNVRRLLELDNNIVHHAITCDVFRQL